MLQLLSAGRSRRSDGNQNARTAEAAKPRRGRLRLVALMAALAVVAGACGSGDRDETAAAGGDGGGSSTVIDPAVFSGEAVTVGGETVDLTTLADKDLVVWFWAPW